MLTEISAKVQCVEINHLNGFSQTPRLVPVYGTSEENKSYNSATPSGNIELTVTNDTAAAQEKFFEPGCEYYVRFEKIPKEVAAN